MGPIFREIIGVVLLITALAASSAPAKSPAFFVIDSKNQIFTLKREAKPLVLRPFHFSEIDEIDFSAAPKNPTARFIELNFRSNIPVKKVAFGQPSGSEPAIFIGFGSSRRAFWINQFLIRGNEIGLGYGVVQHAEFLVTGEAALYHSSEPGVEILIKNISPAKPHCARALVDKSRFYQRGVLPSY